MDMEHKNDCLTNHSGAEVIMYDDDDDYHTEMEFLGLNMSCGHEPSFQRKSHLMQVVISLWFNIPVTGNTKFPKQLITSLDRQV